MNHDKQLRAALVLARAFVSIAKAMMAKEAADKGCEADAIEAESIDKAIAGLRVIVQDSEQMAGVEMLIRKLWKDPATASVTPEHLNLFLHDGDEKAAALSSAAKQAAILAGKDA